MHVSACVYVQKTQGTITRVGQKHTNMGGLYKKGRRWRVEERNRFISNQLYPNDPDSGISYREQFQQVGCLAKLSTPYKQLSTMCSDLSRLQLPGSPSLSLWQAAAALWQGNVA